jgi:hypothetical protein
VLVQRIQGAAVLFLQVLLEAADPLVRGLYFHEPRVCTVRLILCARVNYQVLCQTQVASAIVAKGLRAVTKAVIKAVTKAVTKVVEGSNQVEGSSQSRIVKVVEGSNQSSITKESRAVTKAV